MPVYTVPNGGTLYGGGWTRGAKIKRNMAVIDLTGTLGMGTLDIEPINSLAQGAFGNLLRSLGMNTPLLNFYIRDYEVPKKIGLPQWVAFARDIENYLQSGRDVLVCCTGGHGRTGLVLAIVCSLINPKLVGSNPVPWIRKILCHDCVETHEQIAYVYNILGLPQPTNVHPNYFGAGGAYTTKASNHSALNAGYNDEAVWDGWFKEFEDRRYDGNK